MALVWTITKHVWDVIWRVWVLSGRTHLSLIAAGVAFFGIFSIFPAIAALIALFGLLADPGVVETELALLQQVIPDAAYALFNDQINRILNAGSQTLGWTTVLSVGLALWSARAGVAALVQGLNAIYDIPNRNGIWHAIVSLVITLILIGIAIAALLAVIVAPIAIALVPFSRGTGLLLEAVRWGGAFFVLLAALVILYRYGPNRTLIGLRWVTPGALLVIVIWLASSYGLSTYLSNFASYNEIYGSLGAVIATLLWLYVSAYLILMGAALNVVLEGSDTRAVPFDAGSAG